VDGMVIATMTIGRCICLQKGIKFAANEPNLNCAPRVGLALTTVRTERHSPALEWNATAKQQRVSSGQGAAARLKQNRTATDS
jgi:hypothetical protein